MVDLGIVVHRHAEDRFSGVYAPFINLLIPGIASARRFDARLLAQQPSESRHPPEDVGSVVLLTEVSLDTPSVLGL